MGVVGFVAVAAGLHFFLRDLLYLHADIRSEKLLLLREWAGRAESASFGSSHVHNGFDPRTFDRVMGSGGVQTRSINLAIAGGSQSEQRETALEFLRRMRPVEGGTGETVPQACLVVLELTAGANFTTDHLVHPRAINIYDWPTTRFVMHLTSPAMSLEQRVGRSGYALAAMGLHYMNVGMLSSRIFEAPPDREMMAEQTDEDRRGMLVMPKQTPDFAEIARGIATAPKQPKVTEGVLTPGNAELVEELEAASPVGRLGVAYVVMPMIGDLAERVVYPDTIQTAGGPVPIIDLGRPDRYPQIWRPELWHDEAHLNEAGARVATTIFAEQLKAWYAAHGQSVAGCGR